MVGNVTTITAASAWTQAPSVPTTKAAAPPLPNALPAGNDRSVSGEKLPPEDNAVPAEHVERALTQINEFMARTNRSLRFQVDELSGRTIITVLDETTKEVVRQIPPPELLAVVRRLEQEAGSLIDALG